LNPARLRHKIRIEQKTFTRDAFGGMVETWALFAEARADIIPLSGRELFAAQAVQNETTSKIIIRYISGVTVGMRVVFGTRTLNILAAINFEERNKELQLLCSEGVANG
jgi:SPP1 family predicted phage head-tail adaptor